MNNKAIKGKGADKVVMCLAELAIGIILLINPEAFTSTIIKGLGILLMCLGLGSIIGYFRDTPEDAAIKHGLSRGLIFACAGAVCVFKTSLFVGLFPLMSVLYGVIILVSGFTKLQFSVDMLRLRKKYWFVVMIGAVVSLTLAAIVLINPFATASILWVFISISLIAEAAVDIIAYIIEITKEKDEQPGQ